MIHNKRRVMVYGKRIMHRITGLQGKEVRGRKRKIQTEALSDVYSFAKQGDQITMTEDRACSTHGRDKKSILTFISKPEGQRHLAKHKQRRGNSIKKLRGKECTGLMWLRKRTNHGLF